MHKKLFTCDQNYHRFSNGCISRRRAVQKLKLVLLERRTSNLSFWCPEKRRPCDPRTRPGGLPPPWTPRFGLSAGERISRRMKAMRTKLTVKIRLIMDSARAKFQVITPKGCRVINGTIFSTKIFLKNK